MSQSASDPEERKIDIESKATIFFFLFIIIEGYLILSSANGFYPFVDNPAALYSLYWVGIVCLILGLLIGKYDKILPPLALIGSIIFFLLFMLPIP